MRYYIDGKDEDEDKAATLSSMLPKVENIVKSHMPHACKLQSVLGTTLIQCTDLQRYIFISSISRIINTY